MPGHGSGTRPVPDRGTGETRRGGVRRVVVKGRSLARSRVRWSYCASQICHQVGPEEGLTGFPSAGRRFETARKQEGTEDHSECLPGAAIPLVAVSLPEGRSGGPVHPRRPRPEINARQVDGRWGGPRAGRGEFRPDGEQGIPDSRRNALWSGFVGPDPGKGKTSGDGRSITRGGPAGNSTAGPHFGKRGSFSVDSEAILTESCRGRGQKADALRGGRGQGKRLRSPPGLRAPRPADAIAPPALPPDWRPGPISATFGPNARATQGTCSVHPMPAPPVPGGVGIVVHASGARGAPASGSRTGGRPVPGHIPDVPIVGEGMAGSEQ